MTVILEEGVDEAALVAMASALASTSSVSGTERDAVFLVERAMRDLGFTVEIDEIGNVVGLMGTGEAPILLIDGHIDTIPLHSADDWTVDPFGGEIHDGRLYGLGICDQKASIAAAVHGVAAAARRRPLNGTIAVVASVGEEEMEGCALANVLERYEPDAVVTGEPNDTRLCIGQRGRAKVWVRVTGRSCHAGHATEGVNAAEALAALIIEVGRLDHPVHPDLGRRDITCIDIASWPFPSVSTVPGRAEARFDCRFVPGESVETLVSLFEECAERALAGWSERPKVEVGLVEARFTTWTGVDLVGQEFAPAWWTEPDQPIVAAAQRALTDIGLDSTPTHYRFCTNGSLTAGVLGIPTIGFGVGVESMAHQVDEHVTVDSLLAGARGYSALVHHFLDDRGGDT
jgi:putative selenium metabolism hydrolase